ncbi:AMMONIUM TRANSPORTER MEP2 [Salix purpurea]|uniref:AMMONIUM TRANSPORTER MEP2 n=1 Tax=Salix purpurea TaxID=77065 RepID=A0A9Q0PB42_SALPP|nr:AMMONIUM TRANSPORTER MEP2 [Salix purpurea]
MDEQGDSTWQLTAATLVRLQSVPGLVILYVSIVKKQRVVNSALMALNAFASVLVCWGYHMSFGDKMTRFLGRPDISLGPGFSWVLAQCAHGLFPDCVCCDHLDSDGWLAKLGIVDYSGGYVIHLSSGVAGFTAAYWVLGCFGWDGVVSTVVILHCQYRCISGRSYNSRLHSHQLVDLAPSWHPFLRKALCHRSHAKHDHWSSLCHPSCRSAVPLRLSDENCKLLMMPFMEKRRMHCGVMGRSTSRSRHNSVYGAEDFPQDVPKGGQVEMA